MGKYRSIRNIRIVEVDSLWYIIKIPSVRKQLKLKLFNSKIIQ